MKWTSAGDNAGLVSAIIQDADSGVVRMLGWMNEESLRKTRETGAVWFFSRSRNKLWMKGESSGNTLEVVEIREDCDRDALLVRARANGPTCHQGTTSCFSRVLGEEADDGPAGIVHGMVHGTVHAVDRLAATLQARKGAAPESSYTAKLLAKGGVAIAEKIREEAGELIEALASESDERVASEAADVLYHLLVGLLDRGVPAQAVWDELDRRSGVSGLTEKASRR